ncbi:MAG: TIGR03862 family flavoprotein [Xanthomonadales bacterium]|nr:TIGR03862 family flavoprotein [Xanthomonadales bacterium]
MRSTEPPRLAIIGGGPAGLMAAEAACALGVAVDVFDAMGSVGRKFLVAGKGGLNLTHSEPFAPFVARYASRSVEVATWLERFGADDLRAWSRALGIETFVGSSGRVFPHDLKAAPLLRRWLQRLRGDGVAFHVRRRWLGFDDGGGLRFDTPDGPARVVADAVVLALGGASWPVLGSDGAWVPELERLGVDVAPLRPANCGFDVGWSAHLRARFAGAPVKPVALDWQGDGERWHRQGELVVSEHGLEGSLVYAVSARLREAIAREGQATIHLDLAPSRDAARLLGDLSRPRGARTLSEHLRRHAGIEGVKSALLHEIVPREQRDDPHALARAIKALPIVLRHPRPLAEAISTAGGVRLEALDDGLMLRARPGVFCVGEMLDWEAPTGGYLLTAAMASGRIAGAAAARHLRAGHRGIATRT